MTAAPESIKTFVLATNDDCKRELLTFDIPTAGLDLDGGEHHIAAIRLAKRLPDKRFSPAGYAAFDERDPAAQAFMRLDVARLKAPRILIEIEGGVVTRVSADTPAKVVIIDRDIEGADDNRAVDDGGGGDYGHVFDVGDSDSAADYVAAVFESLDAQERNRERAAVSQHD